MKIINKLSLNWNILLILLVIPFAQLYAQDYTKYVNPFIGTSKMGHVFPGATVPFGMVQLSPQTNFEVMHQEDGSYNKKTYEYCAGYQYRDSTIIGFSHTNFSGTGHSDLGDLLVMPTTGKLILEPIMKVEVVTPDEYMGDIIGDLNSRRGNVGGMDQRGNARVIDCMVPLANMFGYVNTLRSMSQGRAQFTMQFDHYDQVPQAVADEVIAKMA